MIIEQVCNNNVVLTSIEGREFVLLGTGIGFKKNKGDLIDELKIQKKFALEHHGEFSKITSVFEQLSQEEIDLVVDIIEDAKENLNLTVSDSIYTSLADHLHYVIERSKDSIILKCPLDSEIRYIYPQEYKLCLKYVEWVNERFHLSLPSCESSSIVLHFLNAERDEQIFEKTVLETKIIKDVVDIVRRYYGVEFSEDDFYFTRFILHLQYFSKRIIRNEILELEDDSLVDIVMNKYTKANDCAKVVERYLYKSFGYPTNKNELMYLTIHIHKITSKKK